MRGLELNEILFFYYYAKKNRERERKRKETMNSTCDITCCNL